MKTLTMILSIVFAGIALLSLLMFIFLIPLKILFPNWTVENLIINGNALDTSFFWLFTCFGMVFLTAITLGITELFDNKS